jgi:hypothetical protein
MDINERRKPNNTWQFPASCIAVQVKILEVMEFLSRRTQNYCTDRNILDNFLLVVIYLALVANI